MSAKTLSLLQIAQALITGGVVAKAEPGKEPDPDNIQGHDPRAEGGSPTEEQLEAARAESQAGQQAAAAQGGEPGAGGEGGAEGGEGGEGGAGGPGAGDEGGGQGPGGDGDGDEGGQVTKAEILASITFLANHHQIPAEEVAKALGFSGGEGYNSGAPVGQGIELLQKIAESQDGMNKVLDAIAGFLAELSKKTVALGTEIGKSMEAAEAAKVTAEGTAAQLAGILKVAPAMPAKAQVEVTKSLGDGPGQGGAPRLNANDLFKIALKGEHSPAQIASATRAVNYGIPVTL